MELIIEIREKDIGIDTKAEKKVKYNLRKAARAVLFNKEKKIALLYVSKHTYHKLPGGGIKGDEDVMSGLKREVMEETGCTIKVKEPIGVSIEYKNQQEKIQVSYCYFADVVDDQQKPSFTKEETSQGFELKWAYFEQAIKLLENDQPKTYMGKFIRKRDIALLKKAKELMK
ncbi:NUDIX domain-containing protein [Candidatus Woesearchaeota archaeon]|nr:NUDIX domain-containing protein [Candidatus Woesearchaeota archaeon]